MPHAKSGFANMIDDPNHWKSRGQRSRAIAEETRDPVAKSMMLRIAAGYDVLAERVEERARQRPIVEQDQKGLVANESSCRGHQRAMAIRKASSPRSS